MNIATESHVTIAPLRILIGGFCSTLIATLMMYFGARMLLGAPMDIAAGLAGMLGTSWMVGMAIHLLLGTLIFSFAYALLIGPHLPGNALVRGLIWGTLLWLAAMLVIAPMMGSGLFMGAIPPAAASLMTHLVMGVVLALMVPVSTNR